MKKKIPVLQTDEAAEEFLMQDLSDYLHSGNFRPAKFELMAKDEKLNMRLPQKLLAAVKSKAKKQSIPYQKYIRHVLEQAVMAPN